eukprot:1137577-Pelagomonas_calceolata.AAC.2
MQRHRTLQLAQCLVLLPSPSAPARAMATGMACVVGVTRLGHGTGGQLAAGEARVIRRGTWHY